MEERKSTFKTLSHPIRAKIIQLLYGSERISQEEMLKTLRIGPWLLDYHLETLKEFCDSSNGNYKLTEKGKIAYRISKEVEELIDKRDIVVKASLLKRAAATATDFAILGIPMIFASSIEQYFALIVIFFICWTFLESYKGRTPGKHIVKTRVISEDGRRLTLKESAIRNFGKMLLPLDLLANFILFKKNSYLRASEHYARSIVIDEEASF